MDIVEETRLKGQAEIWEHMFAFLGSMALKCAIELGIPDIINTHGHSVTVLEIVNSLKTTTSSSSPNIEYLTRVMRFLVRKRIFSSQFHQESNQIWDFALVNPRFNELFNNTMQCTAEIAINAVLVEYKDGFKGMRSLIDVGGGTGTMIAEIVKVNSHTRGINFDLPHVLATGPVHPQITHVSGDMFIDIPKADAVIMKVGMLPLVYWMMPDWGDEDCVKILSNCYKSIPKNKNGKIIIVDCVLRPDGDTSFDKTSGGKERTEVECKILLRNAGFPPYNIIQIPTFPSIIEAFLESRVRA
ncbi:hypothetical protein MKX01_013330 [Papaver californicum]|nr:hypothetical protein MKX01_013330 [Papaver californicum]